MVARWYPTTADVAQTLHGKLFPLIAPTPYAAASLVVGVQTLRLLCFFFLFLFEFLCEF